MSRSEGWSDSTGWSLVTGEMCIGTSTLFYTQVYSVSVTIFRISSKGFALEARERLPYATDHPGSG